MKLSYFKLFTLILLLMAQCAARAVQGFPVNADAQGNLLDPIFFLRSGNSNELYTAVSGEPAPTNMVQYGTTNYLRLSTGGILSILNNNMPSGVSQVSPHATNFTGAANDGPAVGATSWSVINTNKAFRFRQAGAYTQVKFWIGSTNGMTNFFVQSYKRGGTSGTNWDMSNQSGPLWPLTPNSANTFSIAFTNNAEGDYPGYTAQYSAATGPSFFAIDGSGQYGSGIVTNAAGSLYITNVLAAVTNMPWATGYVDVLSVPIQFYGPTPALVIDSQSMGEGKAVTGDFYGIASGEAPSLSMADQLAYSLGLETSFQNISESGENTEYWISSGKSNVVYALNPKLHFFDNLNNSLEAGSAVATIQTNMLAVIIGDASHGITTVMPCAIPWRAYVLGSDTISSNANYISDWLLTLRSGFTNLIVPDPRPFMSTTWTNSGPPYNNWLLQQEFDSGDGIHLNAAGQKIWAQIIADGILHFEVRGIATLGGIINKGDLHFEGHNPHVITQDRQNQYMSNGVPLEIRAQAAYLLGTNLNGGELWFEAGLPTGNGANKIRFWASHPGVSGNADGTNVDILNVYMGASQAIVELNSPPGYFPIYSLKLNDTFEGGLIWDTNSLITGLVSPSDSGHAQLGVAADATTRVGNNVAIGTTSIAPRETVEMFDRTGGTNYLRIDASGTNAGILFYDGSTPKFSLQYRADGRLFIGVSGGSGIHSPVVWYDANGNYNGASQTNTTLTVNTITVTTNNGSASIRFPRLPAGSGLSSGLNLDQNDTASNFLLMLRDTLDVNLSGRHALYLEGNSELDNTAGNGVYIVVATNNAGGTFTNTYLLAHFGTNQMELHGSEIIDTNLTVSGTTTLATVSVTGVITDTGASVTLGAAATAFLINMVRPNSGSGLANAIRFDGISDPWSNFISEDRDTLLMNIGSRGGINIAPSDEGVANKPFNILVNTNGGVATQNLTTNGTPVFQVNGWATKIFSTLDISSNLTVLGAGILTGNGSGLTNLTPSSILGGVITNWFADAANSGTAETVLLNCVVPASTLSANGQSLDGFFSCVYTNIATVSARLKVYFANTVIFDSGADTLAASIGYANVNVKLIRDSSTSVRCVSTASSTATIVNPSVLVTNVTSLTLTATNGLWITGTASGVGAASGAIVAELGRVDLHQAK